MKIKPLFFAAASKLPVPWLVEHAPLDVLIPYQHVVSDEPLAHIRALYGFKSTRQFEADLDQMLKHFSPVSLPDLIQQKQSGKPFSRKSFLLTFDDGLRQVYDTVMPILLRKGVPAALFVCPAFVDNRQLFYDLKKGLILSKLQQHTLSAATLEQISTFLQLPLASQGQLAARVRAIHYGEQLFADLIGAVLEIDFAQFVQQEQPFMTTAQIHSFTGHGFAVGAHSWDHPLYKLVSPEEQLRQTLRSVKWVCDTFQLPYRSFAFPHTDAGVGKAFFDQLFSSDAAPHLVLGNQTAMTDPHPRVLHRYIGERPALNATTMAKAVLCLNLVRTKLNREVVDRGI